MKKIVQQEHPVLREIAKPLLVREIDTPETKKMIAQMFEALACEKDGVALAAPQINYSKRVFVVSPHIYDTGLQVPLVYINPEIIKKSRDKKAMEEGCLSCRWWYGSIKRVSRVTVKARDEEGNEFTQEASGLLAQIFQHEIEHLDGILFIDKAKNLKEINP